MKIREIEPITEAIEMTDCGDEPSADKIQKIGLPGPQTVSMYGPLDV